MMVENRLSQIELAMNNGISLNFSCFLEIVDELNMGDQNRRTSRRGSLVDEPSHRSSHCADELQNSAINLFASRKFVIT